MDDLYELLGPLALAPDAPQLAERARAAESDQDETGRYVTGPARRARGLYDLPIFGWAWEGDAHDVGRR